MVEILRGTIDLETFELFEENSKKPIKVRRTPTNIRKRPNAHRRHDPICDLNDRVSLFAFQYIDNLEYLSLNYRK